MDIDELNKCFTSIGPQLLRQVLKPQHTLFIPSFDRTVVLNENSLDENAQSICIMKIEKSYPDSHPVSKLIFDDFKYPQMIFFECEERSICTRFQSGARKWLQENAK